MTQRSGSIPPKNTSGTPPNSSTMETLAATNVVADFEKVMKDDKMRKEFAKYLQKHLAKENYDFYTAVEDFEEWAGQDLVEEAMEIWETWVVPSAAQYINLSAKTFKAIENDMKAPYQTMFHAAKEEVVKLIAPMVFSFMKEKGIKNKNGKIKYDKTQTKRETNGPMTPKKRSMKWKASRSKSRIDTGNVGVQETETKYSSPRKAEPIQEDLPVPPQKAKVVTKRPKRNPPAPPKIVDIFSNPQVCKQFELYLKEANSEDYIRFCFDVKLLKDAPSLKERKEKISYIGDHYLGVPSGNSRCDFDDKDKAIFLKKLEINPDDVNIFDDYLKVVWGKLEIYWKAFKQHQQKN